MKIVNNTIVDTYTLDGGIEIEIDRCVDPTEYEDLYGEHLDEVYGCTCREAEENEETEEDVEPEEYVESEEEYPECPEWEELIYESNGKWGIKGAEGWREELPAIYDAIEYVSSGWYKITLNGKMGLVSECGVEEDFGIEYDAITMLCNDTFIVVKDGKTYYVKDLRTFSQGFDEIRVPKVAGWIHAKVDGRWGYIDGNLKFTDDEAKAHEYIIPIMRDYKYLDLEIRHHSSSRKEISECDRMDRELEGCSRDSVEWKALLDKAQAMYCNDDYIKFESNGKFGVKDFLDHELIPPVYEDIVILEGIPREIYVKKDGRWTTLFNHH